MSIPQQPAQHVLLVPVYQQQQQQQQKIAVTEAEGYAQGYESKALAAAPPCQPCQQYHVIAAAAPPPPQQKPIFTPSAAYYARGGIGLGAYISGYKVNTTFLFRFHKKHFLCVENLFSCKI